MNEKKIKLNVEKTKRELSFFEKLIYYKISILMLSIPFIYVSNELLNDGLSGALEPSHKISFFFIFIVLIII